MIESRTSQGVPIVDAAFPIAAATTVNGRLIREARAPKDAIDDAVARGISMKERICPYPDYRIGMRMNEPAKEAMLDGWGPLIHGLGWINAQFFPEGPREAISLRDANTINNVAFSLPTYLVHRAVNPFESTDALPNVVGDMHKASAGVMVAIEKMIEERGEEYMLRNGLEMYVFANRRGLLFAGGSTNQACSADRKMMIPAIEALLLQRHTRPQKSELSEIIPDPASLLRFSVHHIEYSKAGRTFLSQMRRLFRLAQEHLRHNVLFSPDPSSPFHTYVDEYEGLEEAFLAEAAISQRLMNLDLGYPATGIEQPSQQDVVAAYGLMGHTPRTLRQALQQQDDATGGI